MLSTQFVSQIRLRTEDIASFDTYPFSLPAVRNLDVLKLHPKVTFLVGENGSGKSTLLEAIAVSFGFNPEAAPRTSTFQAAPRIRNCIAFCGWGRDSASPRTDFSCAPKASTI